jgi:hypothetical protein
MSFNIDPNFYFRVHGNIVDETNKSSLKKYIEDIFNYQLSLVKDKIPDIEVKFYEINSNVFNASCLKIFSNEFFIVFRNSIFERLFDEFNANVGYFESIEKEHPTSFEEFQDLINFYLIFSYAFLIGHELGHILYGHFNISKEINEFNEFTAFTFDSAVDNTQISQKHQKDIFKMCLELNADMYGVTTVVTTFFNICKNTNIYNKSEHYVPLLKIVVSSIHILFNIIMKNHPIGTSDYPHPTLRISLFNNILTRQLQDTLNLIVVDSDINVKKIIDEESLRIISFQGDNNLGNCDILDRTMQEDIIRDIDIAQESFKSFFEDIQKFSYL